jgi:phosphoribosylanthranilate isomerase
VSPSVHVKICGVTTVDDARACAELGASAIGLNFITASKRCITVDRAREIASALHGTDVLVVGVVTGRSLDALRDLVAAVGLGCLQLQADDPDDVLSALLPHAYKAFGIGSAADVARARACPGDHVLVDARVDGMLGGTGTTFDWSLVRDLAREKKLTIAGGLTPHNVGRAVTELRPFCVDVASGVEHAPGHKDLALVRAFIEEARRAAAP